MPAWLIQILVRLAIAIGIPALVKLFPNIPQAIIDIINQLLVALEGNKDEKKALIADAHLQVKRVCEGIACETDVKNNGD